MWTGSFEIAYASPSCRKKLGYAPDAPMSPGTLMATHPDDTDAVHLLARSIRPEDGVKTMEFRLFDSSGLAVWVEGTFQKLEHERYSLLTTARIINERKRLQQEEKEESARQRALAAESEWIAASPRARQTKSRARIAKYEEMLQKSQELVAGTADIVIPPGPRLGNVVIEAEALCKGYGDTELIEGLNFKLPPGGIVGVIGPNGAGKTTLFRMITGQEVPDSGALRVGDTVKLGYVDQSRDSLDDNNNVWQEISGGEEVIYIGKRAIQSRAYVAAFNFKGSDQQKKVGILSGGERNRVHLAKMLKVEHNVILLDEPTNDLDVDTLRALEDALSEFAGCVVVISHDRWFLDRLATHILAFEGDSHVEWFEGNFQAYEADKRRRLGEHATEPHRIKYRPLMR